MPSRTEVLLLAIAKHLEALNGAMATSFRELRRSKVIESASFRFPASGIIERNYPIPYNAITLVSHSTAQVTAANQPNAGTAPTEGQGTIIVGPLGFGTYNVAGRSLTLYGNPGDYVTITVDACTQQPIASAGQVTLAGTSPVSGTVTVLAPNPTDTYTEAPVSRTTNGNTATLTWPANVTEAWVGVNITGFAGGTNVQIFLDQQDANGIFQTIGSTALLTATGAADFGVGPGQTNASAIMLRAGGAYRLRWVVSGVFTTLTFQLGVTAR